MMIPRIIKTSDSSSKSLISIPSFVLDSRRPGFYVIRGFSPSVRGQPPTVYGNTYGDIIAKRGTGYKSIFGRQNGSPDSKNDSTATQMLCREIKRHAVKKCDFMGKSSQIKPDKMKKLEVLFYEWKVSNTRHILRR